MKFAVAALIASTSAIQIRGAAQRGCLSAQETNAGFDRLDTNHNGSLSYNEIRRGLEYVAEQHDYTPTEADWAWVEEAGRRIDRQNPGSVDRREFGVFANVVAEHFHLCPSGLAEVKAPQGCLSRQETNAGFERLDANHNGSLSYNEIRRGLEYVAEQHDYTPTEADWAWVQEAGRRIDRQNPGSVDENEFFVFANVVAEHFHICPSGLAEVKATRGCLSAEETNEGFDRLDTNHNGSLSYNEIRRGLEYVAEQHHYTPTEADWAWVEEAGRRIDRQNPGSVDRREFGVFANVVAEHFHLCPQA